MNPQQLERLVLLESSGELSRRQRRVLEAELASSADAQQFRDQLRRFGAVLPVPAGPGASEVAAQIDARLKVQRAIRPVFRPGWKTACAVAALLALLAGVQMARRDRGGFAASVSVQNPAEAEAEWSDPLEADFAELEELLAFLDSGEAYMQTEL